MKKFFLAAVGAAMLSQPALAQSYDRVGCNDLGSVADGCTECFDAGSRRVGQTMRPHNVFNAGSDTRIVFEGENQIFFEHRVLNSETVWAVPDDMMQYPDTLRWYTASDGFRRYLMIESGESVRIHETRPGLAISLAHVSDRHRQSDEPDLRLTFITSYRDFLGQGQAGDLTRFRTCIFVSAER